MINMRAARVLHPDPARMRPRPRSVENKTARLTLLLDPRKKAIFEEICAAQDLTPSQVVRQLIRQYIIEHADDRPLPRWLLAASRKKR
jgi:hypothetical protein